MGQELETNRLIRNASEIWGERLVVYQKRHNLFIIILLLIILIHRRLSNPYKCSKH